jgi:hypothetical protein
MALLRHVADVSYLQLARVAANHRLQVEGKFVHVMVSIAYCQARWE